MGLPVLTMPGKSFAARFCHSIVHAAGVPELICRDPEHYVKKALGFVKSPKSLLKIRQALQAGREASVLRDIPALTRQLEALYWQMQAECERGETPAPDLRNLDLYYEIGAELVQGHVAFTDEQSYLQGYREKLIGWNDYAPIAHDNRLWTKEAAASR